MEEADRAQEFLLPAREQPGRVPLRNIGFHPRNRGGQGIIPPHTHTVAMDVCKNGTSKRRYGTVNLVKVPAKELERWRKDNQLKRRQNTLLANFDDADMVFATLKCTHFVGAHKLIGQGSRTYMDQQDGLRLQLQASDFEGKKTQEEGVDAIIYSEQLWHDPSALAGGRLSI